MASSETGEITRLLNELGGAGDPSTPDGSRVLDRLAPLVYGELRRLAHSNRYRWTGEPEPGTTSLVHEAWARLAEQPGAGYESRRQFYRVASKTMRSVLVDNARWHLREKRGGGASPLPLDEERLASAERGAELLALDEALGRLGHDEPELAQIVECRIFGGLTVDETAEALSVSPATVKRRWTLARSWLFRELQPPAP